MSETTMVKIISGGNFMIHGGIIDERSPSIIGGAFNIGPNVSSDYLNDNLLWYSPIDEENEQGGRAGDRLAGVLRYSFNTYPSLLNEYDGKYSGNVSSLGVDSHITQGKNFYGDINSSYLFTDNEYSYVQFSKNIFEKVGSNFTFGFTFKPSTYIGFDPPPQVLLNGITKQGQQVLSLEIIPNNTLEVII